MRFRQDFPCEAQDTKYNRENREAADLDELTAEFVNGEDSEPIAWQSASTD